MTILLFVAVATESGSAPMLEPVDVRSAEVRGELADRIQPIIEQNLLNLDTDGDFLHPFKQRNAHGGYVGLGKHVETLVRLVRYSDDSRILALKERVVREAIAPQEADGYLGIMAIEKRW